MNILVTGSSGWLGQTLVPRLRRDGHQVVGLDPEEGATTDIVGSVVDRALVRSILREHGITAIIHAAARHKPHIATHDNSEFVAVNVQGTLNLLEEAVEAKVDRFVFTSTTSLMISQQIRAGRAGGATEAVWIDEIMAPLVPRNIYGVTKLSAEELCRLFHQLHRLPILILRTARFFPEEDDMERHHPVGRQHEGQRVPVPAAHGRGCRGSARGGARQGAGAGLRHLHHLLDDAVLEGRLPRPAGRRARRRGTLFPRLSRQVRKAGVDHVRLDRPRL
jgi:nucleoside-diphosphate-sugar epimerase